MKKIEVTAGELAEVQEWSTVTTFDSDGTFVLMYRATAFTGKFPDGYQVAFTDSMLRDVAAGGTASWRTDSGRTEVQIRLA